MREKGTGKVEFLALREMIEKELAAGWPVKVVWRRFKTAGRISIEYQQFRAYCKRILGYPRKAGIEHHDNEQDRGNPGVIPDENLKVENTGLGALTESEANNKDKEANRTGPKMLDVKPRKFDWKGRKTTKEELIG
jgi:Family of unknown function (DUF5338)